VLHHRFHEYFLSQSEQAPAKVPALKGNAQLRRDWAPMLSTASVQAGLPLLEVVVKMLLLVV
jgi:hypothetical protein